MHTRADIAPRYAPAYLGATKKDKGRILSEVVRLTGWSRDNARRRLLAAGRSEQTTTRHPRAKYSDDARRLLRWLWEVSGEQCGKYLAVSMPVLVDALERHGELTEGEAGYGAGVRGELLSMSAATIDRYLRAAKAESRADSPHRTTAPTPSPAWQLGVGSAPGADTEPGYVVAGLLPPSLPAGARSHPRTLQLTDLYTGWTFTRTVPAGDVATRLLDVLDVALQVIPFYVVTLDFADDPGLIDLRLITWARQLGIEVTSSGRPGGERSAVARSAWADRWAHPLGAETGAGRAAPNKLWELIDDRANYLTPTRRPLGWSVDRAGRRKRLYDEPALPVSRLLAAGVISRSQQASLTEYRRHINPACIHRNIRDLLAQLDGPQTRRGHPRGPVRLPGTVSELHPAARPMATG